MTNVLSHLPSVGFAGEPPHWAPSSLKFAVTDFKGFTVTFITCYMTNLKSRRTMVAEFKINRALILFNFN